ncbi:putative sterol carrier protein [Mycobacteroides abscessus subsp. abscessus]|nr:putative sterol carrier protein [Mycobacteroides abscessus subsp. abscessus]
MAVFADAEEVYRYLAGIFRRGLENEDLANRLAGSGVVLRIHYTDMAMAKGTVRAKGPVTKLIKLIPQAKNLFPEYRAILEADKRHDLLNV